jgi:type I restriction enzyme, S subunit
VTFTSARVRRVFMVVNGGTPTSEPKNWDGGHLWVTPEDLSASNGGSIVTTNRTITSLGIASSNAVLCPPGSLVISTRAPIGYVARLAAPASTNQGCKALIPRNEEDTRYYKYQFLALRSQLESLGNGSTFRELSSKSLASLSILRPPLPEQRAIANYLDRETARIDALIDKKQQARALVVERLAHDTSTMTKAGAIGQQDFINQQPDSQWIRLKRCFHLVMYGIGEATREFGRIAVLGMGNVNEGRVVGNIGGYVDAVDPVLELRAGDLLFNRTNSLALVGKVAHVDRVGQPTTIASYLVLFRVNNLANAKYLNYVLNTQEVLGLARSMALPSIGQANLNPTRYSAMRILLPSLEAQRELVLELDARHQTAEALTGHLDSQVALLQERRQALITAAVAGQMDSSEAA